MGKQPPVSNTPRPRPADSKPEWTSADEASWESFPASDPPAVGSVFDVEPPREVDREPEAPRGEDDEEGESDEDDVGATRG